LIFDQQGRADVADQAVAREKFRLALASVGLHITDDQGRLSKASRRKIVRAANAVLCAVRI